MDIRRSPREVAQQLALRRQPRDTTLKRAFAKVDGSQPSEWASLCRA
jgi:hypothetical protein